MHIPTLEVKKHWNSDCQSLPYPFSFPLKRETLKKGAVIIRSHPTFSTDLESTTVKDDFEDIYIY